MTAIKEEAIRLMEQVPDNLVQEMMATMRDFLDKSIITVDVGTKTGTTASAAFNNFLSHCKKSTLSEDYKEFYPKVTGSIVFEEDNSSVFIYHAGDSR